MAIKNMKLALFKFSFLCVMGCGESSPINTEVASETNHRQLQEIGTKKNQAQFENEIQRVEPNLKEQSIVPDAVAEDDVRRFLLEFGKKVNERDLAFIEKHVQFPLKVEFIKNENVGNPIYGKKLIKGAGEFLESSPTSGMSGVDPNFTLKSDYDRAIVVAETAGRTTVTVPFGQFEARLILSKEQGIWVLQEIKRNI